MKRSEINFAIKRMEQVLSEKGINIPPFCGWTPEEWKTKGHEFDEIRDNKLGWDITDFGTGNFCSEGFSLITLRNGNVNMRHKYPKAYAEKLLLVEEGQHAAMHFHQTKMEDIINRAGGNILIRIFRSTEGGECDNADVTVHQDGRTFSVAAGAQIRLCPGESITIPPYMYHDFAVESGTGAVVLGEVSMCNDDDSDNRFRQKFQRFPQIEEDEPPYRWLCGEYPLAN